MATRFKIPNLKLKTSLSTLYQTSLTVSYGIDQRPTLENRAQPLAIHLREMVSTWVYFGLVFAFRQKLLPWAFAFTVDNPSASAVGQTSLSSLDTDRTLQPCYYRTSATEDKWRKRIEFKNLKVGQELKGIVVQDLLGAKKGPKLFLDCGVCRPRHKNWSIVNGMLRLSSYKKDSVLRKKAARLKKKSGLTVYVSRIFHAEARFEVVLDAAEVPQHPKALRPSSQLVPGTKVRGHVVRWNEYGVIVRILGYNRSGLLHILRVRETYGKYIDGKTGLRKTLPQSISCVVVSNEKKRLFLDFDDEFKNRILGVTDENTDPNRDEDIESSPPLSSTEMKQSESEDSSSLSSDQQEYYDSYAEDGEDYYEEDEDFDLEDRFGIGTY